METLTDDEESQLCDDVKKAVDLVEDGLSPDDAVEKIARDRQYGPGKIRLLGYGYNTGRQTAQRETGDNVLDKLASFPVVDPEAVILRAFGAEKKAATIDPAYLAPPAWIHRDPLTKLASDPFPDFCTLTPPDAPQPALLFSRARLANDRDKQASEELGRKKSAAEDQLRIETAGLIGYFKEKFAYDRLTFDVVEKVARDYFGPQAKPILDYVFATGKLERMREKRADDKSVGVLRQPVNLNAVPFSTLANCLKFAEEIIIAREAYEAVVTKLATDKEERIRPFCKAGVATVKEIIPDPLYSEKAADLFSTPALMDAGTLGSMISKGLSSTVPTKDKMIDDAWMDLEDPQHQNELRKIKAHTMLNGFMTDPDDPISGHDPDKVLKAYNELSQLSPRAGEQPAIMGPLLRRRLAGNFEPFEAKEVTDMEKNLTQTKSTTPHTSLLSNAPDKLLG